jgi:hypothetical protein
MNEIAQIIKNNMGKIDSLPHNEKLEVLQLLEEYEKITDEKGTPPGMPEADQIIGGAKEMFGFKKGGVVCRGQGMAKNKKITKMY